MTRRVVPPVPISAEQEDAEPPRPCPPGGTRTQACEHLRTEKREGKTYCRTCERQLYL